MQAWPRIANWVRGSDNDTCPLLPKIGCQTAETHSGQQTGLHVTLGAKNKQKPQYINSHDKVSQPSKMRY